MGYLGFWLYFGCRDFLHFLQPQGKKENEFATALFIFIDSSSSMPKMYVVDCDSREISVLSWYYKPWLRSQAFNMGNVG